MFLDYDPSVVLRWARALRWFRFHKGINSGQMWVLDEFKLRLQHDTEDDLRALVEGLALEHESAAGNPEEGYYTRFALEREQIVAGQPCSVCCSVGFLEISVLPAKEKRLLLTEDEFEAALAIEGALAALDARTIDPPSQIAEHCLCPHHFPQLWQDSPEAGRSQG